MGFGFVVGWDDIYATRVILGGFLGWVGVVRCFGDSVS